MKQLLRTVLLQALLLAAPVICFAQSFEGLYDQDSSINEGWDILLKPDSSYFIVGFVQDPPGQLHLSDMQVSADGSQEISNHLFRLGNITAYTYIGNNGSAMQLPGGGYLLPVTLQTFPVSGGILRSLAGLAKLDAQGDTVFVKFYTDTTTYFEYAFTCAIMPDGGYLLGANRSSNPDSSGFPSVDSVLLIRTDSNGNMLWSKIYQKYATQYTTPNTLDTLSNGRILMGAMSSYDETVSGGVYSHETPWFVILDSMGNILKDSLYGTLYAGGGAIFKDMNGGYYHFGALNEPIVSHDSYGDIFLPFYVAHLDTNFNITWITIFPYSPYFQDRIPDVVRQTHDSGYVIAGDINSDSTGWDVGWGAKVDKNGTLLWSHTYVSDSDADSYFSDVRERPDGSLIFCGYAHSDTLPAWHGFYDAWLVSVDSNGCLQAGCGPDTTDLSLGVPASPILSKGEVMVYPNPTHGNLTVKTNESGVLYIYSMLGQLVAQYPIVPIAIGRQMDIQLPKDMMPGVYMGSFKPANGAAATEVRIVFENNY